MRHSILQTLTAAALLAISATYSLAHSDRGEKRPQTYAEAFIPFTKEEFKREPEFRHPPGNVRAEDMHALFANRVLIYDAGRKFSTVKGVSDHAVSVIFFGPAGRFLWCSYGNTSDYYLRDHKWAPTKFRHGKKKLHLLHAAVGQNKRPGASPLYDGKTGQIVLYRHRDRIWQTRAPGHLQQRLPSVIYTLCPDFPSPEELGVEVNEAQTAITYDKLLQQDPGRRVLRPDLITLDPTESVQ